MDINKKGDAEFHLKKSDAEFHEEDNDHFVVLKDMLILF